MGTCLLLRLLRQRDVFERVLEVGTPELLSHLLALGLAFAGGLFFFAHLLEGGESFQILLVHGAFCFERGGGSPAHGEVDLLALRAHPLFDLFVGEHMPFVRVFGFADALVSVGLIFYHFCLEHQLPVLPKRILTVLQLILSTSLKVGLQIADGLIALPQGTFLQ